MTFEFAKATEVTEFAFEKRPSYADECYKRFFVCPDVHVTWFFRLLEGFDGEYNREEGSFILERSRISNYYKGQPMTISRLTKIIKDDDLSNWDYQHSIYVDDLIEMVDGGFGINNLAN